MKKKNKITIADKALTNAIKKGEISLSDLPKSKRSKVKSIANSTSDEELEKASKNKYKYSRRTVKHISNSENFNNNEKINNIKMEKKFIKKFDKFSKINESDEPSEPKMYPKENKFKRIIEFSGDIENSLVSHNFNKGDGDGDFIVFDLMDKSYKLVSEMDEDIRPCESEEFDHMMNNL